MTKARFQGSVDVEDEDFRRAFIEGNLIIDCSEIRIVQKDSAEPTQYIGPGFMQISAELGVLIRMVSHSSESTADDAFRFTERFNAQKAGAIVPGSHYYRLEARDVTGDLWTCDYGEVEASYREETTSLVFTSERIRCEAASTGQRPYAYFVFLDPIRVPKNTSRTTTVEKAGKPWRSNVSWDVSEGQIGGLHLHCSDIGGAGDSKHSIFVASGETDAYAPSAFDDRLIETIRFCTASLATPVMRQVRRIGKRVIELSRARDLNRGLVEPPIEARKPNPDFYRLFECYYRYASTHAVERAYSPISAKIFGLFALKGVGLETIVLLLCVTIERLLNEDEFKGLGKPALESLTEVNKIIEVLRHLDLSEPMSKRVRDSLTGFKSNSASDRLHVLIEAGVLEEADRKTWKTSRNAVAHGSFDIAPKENQKVVDTIFRLISMIYKMVFFRIGYSGSYTNFSALGWPVHQFDAEACRAVLATKRAGSSFESTRSS